MKIGRISAALVALAGLCGAASAAERGVELAQMGPGMGPGMGMGRGMGPGMGGMGPGGGMGMMQHGPGHQGNPVRHRVVRMGGGVPAPYTDMKNPSPGDAASIAVGKQLYVEQCSTCHGAGGAGDGAAGSGLEPKPANLAFIMDKWVATDGFLMWSMSEGGEPLGTAMPAFKHVLSETQRWQIVDYMRGGFSK